MPLLVKKRFGGSPNDSLGVNGTITKFGFETGAYHFRCGLKGHRAQVRHDIKAELRCYITGIFPTKPLLILYEHVKIDELFYGAVAAAFLNPRAVAFAVNHRRGSRKN